MMSDSLTFKTPVIHSPHERQRLEGELIMRRDFGVISILDYIDTTVRMSRASVALKAHRNDSNIPEIAGNKRKE